MRIETGRQKSRFVHFLSKKQWLATYQLVNAFTSTCMSQNRAVFNNGAIIIVLMITRAILYQTTTYFNISSTLGFYEDDNVIIAQCGLDNNSNNNATTMRKIREINTFHR